MAKPPSAVRSHPSEVHKVANALRSRLPLSRSGILFCAIIVFLGIAGSNTQANLLFGILGLMIGLFIAATLISGVMVRKLDVKRSVPPHASVGQPMAASYDFTNRKKRWSSVSVTLVELDATASFVRPPQCFLLHVPPRSSATVRTEFLPQRRGVYVLDRYRLSSGFPFGFLRRSVAGRQEDSIVIHPAIGEVDQRLIQMCRSAETSGPTVRPRPDGSDECYGVKEFREGDNARLIHWRRSARTGTLVTRQMTRVSPPRVLLVVDTFTPQRTVEEHTRVERAIAMAASLASRALDDGLAVGLCAFSGELVRIRPGRGKRHRDDLLSILARLSLNTTQSIEPLLEHAAGMAHDQTTQVVFTPRVMDTQTAGRSGAMIVASSSALDSEGYFRFPEEIDFSNCMPLDQQPMIQRRFW